MIIIGIDPDIDKSGIAIYNSETGILNLYNKCFFDLLSEISWQRNEEYDVIVLIECGYLNKSNWHATKNKAKYAAAIGAKVGANHQISRLLVEFCEREMIDYREIQPKRKKLNHQDFIRVSGLDLNQTNQEQRDAAMLILSSKEYLVQKSKVNK